MRKITSGSDLKNAIQLLEEEQINKEKLLKEQFFLAYESLKPANLIKNTLKDLSSSPYLIENIVGSAVGIATGYVSKKIVVGASANIVRKVLGSVMQFGVTNLVAQNPDVIKKAGRHIIQYIFDKMKKNKDKHE